MVVQSDWVHEFSPTQKKKEKKKRNLWILKKLKAVDKMLRRRGKEVKKKKLIYNYFLEQDIKSGQFIWPSMKDFSKLLLNKFQKRS